MFHGHRVFLVYGHDKDLLGGLRVAAFAAGCNILPRLLHNLGSALLSQYSNAELLAKMR